MKTKPKDKIGFPQIVSLSEWQKARDKLLVKEKAATRARDALAAERRRLPMVRIEKDYIFSGPDGKARLLDLFEGRRQLILYHFMFAPGVHGWPNAGCDGCSMFVDQVSHLAHLHARHTSFCLVSRAPLPKLQRYRKRMGWNFPWVSSAESDFNKDFGVTTGSANGSAGRLPTSLTSATSATRGAQKYSSRFGCDCGALSAIRISTSTSFAEIETKQIHQERKHTNEIHDSS